MSPKQGGISDLGDRKIASDSLQTYYIQST